MSKLLRQPSDIAWGAGAMTNTVVDGSNRIVLSGGETPIPDCILWGKLEDRFVEIGTDFTVVGAPAWVPVRWNNGVYSDDAALNNLETPVQDGLTNACVVTFVCKTDFAMINGDPQDGGTHVLFTIYQANLTKLWVQFQGGGNRTQVVRIRNGGAETDTFNITDASLTWNAGDLVRIAVAIDANGIGGGADTMRFYVNGALSDNYVGALGAEVTSGGWKLVLLGRPIDYAADADMAIDNIKVFSSTANLAAKVANGDIEGWPIAYAANGDYQSPVIDCGAGERPFLFGWTRSAYVDDEYIESIRIRGSNDAPAGAATGQGIDDDGTPHDYWSGPVWSPQNWETLTQDVQPVTHYRYIQLQANLVAATDLEDTPELQTLRMLFRSSALDAASQDIRVGERIKEYHLEMGGIDLAGGTSTLKFPIFTMRRGRGAAGLKLSSASFRLENTSGAFNVGNPEAWFGGQQVYGISIDAWLELTGVEQGRFDLWKGIGTYIKSDERRKTATLYGQQIHKTFTAYDVTRTDNAVTPAAALQDALTAAGWIAGVDYDSLSFLNSAQRQQDAAIYINYNYSAAGDSIKLSEFIRAMTMIGCADVFFFGGLLYYRAWTPYVAGLAASLTQFEEAPIVNRAMKNYYNDYRIDHSGGSTETDGGNNDIGMSSRANFGQRVFVLEETAKLEVADANAAVGLGDLYIQRDLPHNYGGVLTPLANVTCGVDIAYLNTITLDSFVTLTWPREGFDARVFEVMGMVIDSNRELLRLQLREAVRA